MDPEYKAAAGTLDDERPGRVTSVFATLNVIDRDNDVVLPGAFTDGQAVKMMWAHDWTKWIGDGVIRVTKKEAIFDGEFWLDTFEGEEAYKKVKRASSKGLSEWSWGYFIPEGAAHVGEFQGRPVRFLGDKPLEVPEVSPVAVGAGINTRTTAIKSGEPPLESGEKPLPNEHACRLKDPADFQTNSFRRTSRVHDGKRYAVIMGKLKGESTMTDQAFRYPKDAWTPDEARSHCQSHDGIGFEAASDKGCESCGDTIPVLDIIELPFSEHLELVVADVMGLVTRSQQRAGSREKVGRRLSRATRTHLSTVRDSIDALLREDEREPETDSDEPKAATPADLLALYQRFQEQGVYYDRLLGVAT